ncbi:beta-1,4-glucuronyltransferase 1-like isoform X2 [Amphibalanus amphitrite]|uniref:beta-1,4-glucuronyltransferase 1-like isoform X2 n=1 Tax=Amphibalanus amphitrite TaxID=1232801 RepID=UPI001C90FB82|nr:beta-1,4-glucuronyltransferase 1-like isoform X2 [Amphibalanus amphitrite]
MFLFCQKTILCCTVHARKRCRMRTKTFLITMTVLVTALVILQIIHSVLLDQLDEYEHDPSHVIQNIDDVNVYAVEAERLLSQLLETVRDKATVDDSGQYQIVQNVISNVKDTRQEVSLALHASVESLNHLPTTIRDWEGPVSVSMFVSASMADQAALRLLALHLCSGCTLSLHLVLPVGVRISRPVVPHQSALCRTLESSPSVSYQLSEPYPNNLLRNVARNATHTEFVLSLDADITPNVGFRQQFLAMANRNNLWGDSADLTAFVLPLYEVGEGVTPPRDKTTLLELRRRWPQLLRPFYITLCAKCQAPTDFERWETMGVSGRLEVAYDVPWKDPWEPVYVIRRGAPLYDPRFKQFGFNRISHACELHVAGYRFRVLGDAFVLHHGLKGEEPPRAAQSSEQHSNRLLFRQFKQELKVKYPKSARRCY